MKITQKGHGRLLTLANLISMCALTGIGRPLGLLAFSGLFSTAAYILTDKSIAHFALLLLKANRVGVDMGKANKPLLPESLGIAAGTIYLIIMFLYLPIPFLSPPSSRLLFSSYFSSNAESFQQLGAYSAALLAITTMLFLGFADDILNLKWRHKLLLPAIASLPLLMIYNVMGGATSVLLPSFSFKYTDFRFTIQTTLVDIGITYYLYMAMLAIFCTHSINILAGVNGVEVGQSLIIAGSLAVHNCLSICSQSKFWAFSKVYDDQMCLKILMNNQLSLTILLPFIGVSLALLKNNWYPASIFVGDTFCYFSGMTLAVAGILGHSGRILLVLLIPQIVNFLLSLPQLFGIIVCPRHRLPTLDPSTGLLKPSIFEIHLQPGSPGFLLVQKLLIPTNLAALNCTNNTLIENQSEKKNQTLTLKNDKHDCVNKDINVTVVNLTLLNVILKYFGPMHEARLTLFIIGFQLLSSLIVLSITHLHPTKIVTNIMRTLAENLNV